jgi:hypothetical protein
MVAAFLARQPGIKNRFAQFALYDFSLAPGNPAGPTFVDYVVTDDRESGGSLERNLRATSGDTPGSITSRLGQTNRAEPHYYLRERPWLHGNLAAPPGRLF